MSKPIDDGGPAFPTVPLNHGYGHDTDAEGTGSQTGLTLRDYLAAKAATGLIAGYDYEMREFSSGKARTGFDDTPHGCDSSYSFADQLAQEAYTIADALLVARTRKAGA